MPRVKVWVTITSCLVCACKMADSEESDDLDDNTSPGNTFPGTGYTPGFDNSDDLFRYYEDRREWEAQKQKSVPAAVSSGNEDEDNQIKEAEKRVTDNAKRAREVYDDAGPAESLVESTQVSPPPKRRTGKERMQAQDTESQGPQYHDQTIVRMHELEKENAKLREEIAKLRENPPGVNQWVHYERRKSPPLPYRILNSGRQVMPIIKSWHIPKKKEILGSGTYGTVYESSVKELDEGGTTTEWTKGQIPIAVKEEKMEDYQRYIPRKERESEKQQFETAVKILSQCERKVLPMIFHPRSKIGIVPSMMIVKYKYPSPDPTETTQAITIMGPCPSLIDYVVDAVKQSQSAGDSTMFYNSYLKRMLDVLDICDEILKKEYFHEDLKCGNVGVLTQGGETVFLDLDSLKPLTVLARSYTTTNNSIKSGGFRDYTEERRLEHKAAYRDTTLETIQEAVAVEINQLIFWSGQIATLFEVMYFAKIPGSRDLYNTYVYSSVKHQHRFSHKNAKTDTAFLLRACHGLIKAINIHFKAFQKDKLVEKLTLMYGRIQKHLGFIGKEHLRMVHHRKSNYSRGNGGPA